MQRDCWLKTGLLCVRRGRKVAVKHGNMFADLRDNHPVQFRKIKSSHTSSSAGSSSAEAIVQPTVKEAFQRQASYGPSSHRAKEINHAIAYYIAKDMIPVHTVAKPGFQKLMETTVPLFKIPSEKFFSKTELHRMYTSLKEEVGKSIALENGMQQPLTCGPAVEEADISFSIHYLLDSIKLPGNTVLSRRPRC